MVTSVSPSTMPPWYCRYSSSASAARRWASGRAAIRAMACRYCFSCSMGPVMVSIQLMSVLP